MSALDDIAAERQRQKAVEGWTEAHDDEYEFGDIALAAAAYAAASSPRGQQGDVMVGRTQEWRRAGWFDLPRLLWPWTPMWWKPTTPRRNLVKAGALIVAEIERLDRAALKSLET